jgi:hypothetical protein
VRALSIHIPSEQRFIICRRGAARSSLETKIYLFIYLFEAEINERQARPQRHADSWRTRLRNANGFKFWFGIRQYRLIVK